MPEQSNPKRRQIKLPSRQKPAERLRFRDLPPKAGRRIAKRTFDQFRADGVTNLAGALTFRAVLSLFPGLVALVALLAVFGTYPETYDSLVEIVSRIAPHSTVNTVIGPLQGIISHKGGAKALLGAGLGVAIWAASGYIGTFSWTTNVIWEARRGRSWYRQWPLNFAVTIVSIILIALLLIILVVSGPLARSISEEIGFGATGADIWQYARWPAIAVIAIILIASLFYIAPNVRQRSHRWMTPGAIVAVIGVLVVTGLFSEYVSNFGTYNNTYGTLGAIITFLIWVWLANISVLVGVELDSEIEREHQLAAGTPPGQGIDLPLRQK